MRRSGIRAVLPFLGSAAVALGLLASGGSARPAGSAATCDWNRVRVPPVTHADLYAVSARSPQDVWIVGSQGEFDQEQTLVLHYDGESVQVVPTPDPFSVSSELFGIAAFGPDDVWAVGQGLASTEPVYHYEPLLLHFDGERWSHVPAPTVDAEFGGALYAVAGAAVDDIWAVGQVSAPDGDGWVGLIEHWDGHEWRIVASPNRPYRTVAAVSSDDVWAAGPRPEPSGRLTAHRDGRSWKLVEDAVRPGWWTDANAASASGPKNVWIVSQEAAGPFGEWFARSRITRGRLRIRKLGDEL